MRAEALFEEISYRLVGNFDSVTADIRLDGVVTQVKEADDRAVFVCVRTALGNGHDEAVAAYGKGCRVFVAERVLPLPDDAAQVIVSDTAAVLAELAARALGYPARQLTVLGIMGAVGKSSVAYTTASLLERSGHKVALLTTDGERIGESFVPAANIVADGVALQRFFARAVAEKAKLAVVELSAYMLAQKTAFSIPFSALLLTSDRPCYIGDGPNAVLFDHRAALEEMLAGVPFCVLPDSCQISLARYTGRVLRFGKTGDFCVERTEAVLRPGRLGINARLRIESAAPIAVFLPVWGDFAADNAAAAAALAAIAGLNGTEIARGLSLYAPAGRLECIATAQGRFVFVDSAYTPDALERSLLALRPYARGRILVVIGSVGGRAHHRREPLGRVAADLADTVYLTADDPDCEDPAAICREMAKGASHRDRCEIEPDRRTAIRRAFGELREGDLLLLAGKGACGTQLIRGRRIPFCDREVITEMLSAP